jgi:hypothetical protein
VAEASSEHNSSPSTNKIMSKWSFAESEVLTAMVMRSSIFWDIMPLYPRRQSYKWIFTSRPRCVNVNYVVGHERVSSLLFQFDVSILY